MIRITYISNDRNAAETAAARCDRLFYVQLYKWRRASNLAVVVQAVHDVDVTWKGLRRRPGGIYVLVLVEKPKGLEDPPSESGHTLLDHVAAQCLNLGGRYSVRWCNQESDEP